MHAEAAQDPLTPAGAGQGHKVVRPSKAARKRIRKGREQDGQAAEGVQGLRDQLFGGQGNEGALAPWLQLWSAYEAHQQGWNSCTKCSRQACIVVLISML